MVVTELELVFCFLEAYDDPDLPDGAWWGKLENGVTAHNEWFDTDYDEFETVSAYASRNNQE